MERGLFMDKEKLKGFLNGLKELEEKYGFFISAGYEEHFEYTWDEEIYPAGGHPYLIYTDEEGNEVSEDYLNIVDFDD